jgi:hypothetical protein
MFVLYLELAYSISSAYVRALATCNTNLLDMLMFIALWIGKYF